MIVSCKDKSLEDVEKISCVEIHQNTVDHTSDKELNDLEVTSVPSWQRFGMLLEYVGPFKKFLDPPRFCEDNNRHTSVNELVG